jgi:probable F420-dependent oxidoreductase
VLYGVANFPTEYSVQPDELARLAEERGFESLWFSEHTHIPVAHSPWPGGPTLPKEYIHTYDPFLALTAAATATRQLRLGTGICLIVQRDPIVTAKEVASLDRLSGGRFVFGVGGGWNQPEVENHGTRFDRRFGVLRERILAMKALWTEDEPSFRGRYVSFDKVWLYPKPSQQPHPPVLLGGDGARTFERVIEFADGWIPISRRGQPPPDLGERIPGLRRRAEAAGRDPARISVTVYFCPPQPEVVADLTRAGVDRVVFLVPSAARNDAIPVLDSYARLIV